MSAVPTSLPLAGRWAAWYARRGWGVLPCRPRSKAPIIAGGVHAATRDLRLIATWWHRWPAANVAVVPGPGWAVVDTDSSDAMHALAARGWDLPATAAVKTPRGLHLYYRLRRDVPSRCGIAPGVDLVGTDCTRYLVAPPSVHPSGAAYRWERPLHEAAPAPKWLHELADDRAPAPAARVPLRELLARPVRRGCRNDTMTRVAGLAFKLLPAAEAVLFCMLLNERYFDPPLPPDEVERTLASVARKELEARGGRKNHDG